MKILKTSNKSLIIYFYPYFAVTPAILLQLNVYIYIKYTTYECLVKIKHYRHEYSSILCKIRKKGNKIKMYPITCSHIWYFDMSV